VIEVAEIVVHEADEPNFIGDLLDADLLNPLKVAPETILDLRVLQTIKDGVVVHDALE
jgi:predicted amidohydrolase YtcJ